MIEGDFDPSFLELPDEILITVMRDHQKYFAVEKRGGELAPHFLAVINLAKDAKGWCAPGTSACCARGLRMHGFSGSPIKMSARRLSPQAAAGHLRVALRQLPRQGGAHARHCALAREQWFNLGMVQAHVADADRAAELAKCDLATEMVSEFTELQGVVGGLYARAQGESEDVADAVYDHYRPVGLDDPIPRNLTGCAVALADKLDSIVGCFCVGVVPTGSSDPYALRRAALGIVKIILERKIAGVVVAGDWRGVEGAAHAPAEEGR